MSIQWKVALGFCVAIPVIVVGALVARSLTHWPMSVILASGLVFIFIFDLALALTLPHFAKHKDLRTAFVLLLLPMPVLALGGFLAASERTSPYAMVLVPAGVVLGIFTAKASLSKLRRLKEEKNGAG